MVHLGLFVTKHCLHWNCSKQGGLLGSRTDSGPTHDSRGKWLVKIDWKSLVGFFLRSFYRFPRSRVSMIWSMKVPSTHQKSAASVDSSVDSVSWEWISPLLLGHLSTHRISRADEDVELPWGHQGLEPRTFGLGKAMNFQQKSMVSLREIMETYGKLWKPLRLSSLLTLEMPWVLSRPRVQGFTIGLPGPVA